MSIGFDAVGSAHKYHTFCFGEAYVQRLVEDLEKREQEIRKLSQGENQKQQFENERINEGKEELSKEITPSLERNDVLSEDGRIKGRFKDETHSTTKDQSVYLIDTAQKLHTAVKENDIATIEKFIESNYELNDEDSSKATPLLIAVMNHNFEAARLLIQAHVDVLVKKLYGPNASSRSWYISDRERVRIAHTNLLTLKIIEKEFEAAQIGKILGKLHCNLNEVVKYRDSIITKAYLESCPDEVGIWMSFPGNNMLDFNVEHIRIVINDGPLAKKRKREFVMHFSKRVCEYQKTLEGRDFLKKLATWEFIDEDFLEFLEEYLQELPKKFVKIILQHNFRKIAEAKFGWDISRICFGNPHPKVIRLLKKEDIDVDRRYYGNNTPLHISSKYSAAKNIQMLLRQNADPNVKNDELDTPMTLTLKSEVARFWSPVKSVRYLLLAGADIMGISNRYKDTFYGFNGHQSNYCYATKVIKLLIAQIAIYEVVGFSVEDLIENFMNLGNQELQMYFEECRQKLCKLKKHTSYHKNQYVFQMKFNILEILCEKPEKMVRYVNEERLKMIAEIMSTYNRKSLNLFYRELLRQRVKDIVELHPCRQKAIKFVSHFTGIEDPHHLVVHNIVDYLSARDLKMFKDKYERESTS